MLTPLVVVVMNELSYRIHKLFVFRIFSAVTSGLDRWYAGRFLRMTASSPTVCTRR